MSENCRFYSTKVVKQVRQQKEHAVESCTVPCPHRKVHDKGLINLWSIQTC